METIPSVYAAIRKTKCTTIMTRLCCFCILKQSDIASAYQHLAQDVDRQTPIAVV